MSTAHIFFLWPLWGLSLLILLTRTSCQARTAMTRLEQLSQGIISITIPVTTIILANLLIWLIVLRWPLPPSNWLLVLITTGGIGLLTPAFQTPLFSGALRGESLSRFMAGMAWACCWSVVLQTPGTGSPFIPFLGAACALLPDTLDRWISRFIHRIDIHIVPDPLEPDAKLVAGAIADAITRCREIQRPMHIELYPGQDQTGHWHQYILRLDSHHKQIVVTHAGTDACASLPVAVASDSTHSLTTAEAPLSLSLIPSSDGRVRICVMPWQQGWTHSLLLATCLGLALGVLFGLPAGVIAGGAFALHILMDQLGFGEVHALYPFTRRRQAGFQVLKPTEVRLFNISTVWLAVILCAWTLLRPQATPESPSLIQVLVLAGILPLAALAWLGKRREAPAIWRLQVPD